MSFGIKIKSVNITPSKILAKHGLGGDNKAKISRDFGREILRPVRSYERGRGSAFEESKADRP